MPQCSLTELASHPKAALLILHGLAEYAQRYRRVAQTFASRGISTFAFDQRGHGGNKPKTHVDRFDLFVDDALSVAQQIRAEHPSMPLFVWGHSMGSIVALQLAARHGESLDGLILTSSSPDVFKSRPSHVLLPLLRALARVAPRMRVSLALDTSQLSHDEAVQRAYANDPLIPKSGSLRLLTEFAFACERADDDAAHVRVPTLVLHGECDGIAPASGSQRLYDRLGSADKDLTVLPELRHELQNEREPDRANILQSISQWMLARGRIVSAGLQ